MQELWVSFVEKLDDELYKALQLTLDVYGSEYQEILANSSKFMILLLLIARVQMLVTSIGQKFFILLKKKKYLLKKY